MYENDIIPGCYILDLGIHFEFSKIWIRADYIRIYDYLENYSNKMALTPGHQRPL
jgi:hypothetical protein